MSTEARDAMLHAVALHDAGDFNAAIPFYIRAVTLAPTDPEVLYASGIALGQAGKDAEAIAHFKGAIRFGKNGAEVWNALGMAYVGARKFGDAERCFQRVTEREPNAVTAWVMFANFAYAAGQTDVGDRRYTQAVSVRATNAGDRFSQSLVWLTRGQYRLGWTHYEARREMGNWLMRNRQQRSLKAKPVGPAQLKAGMRVLIEAEQGQGDAVQMARFLVPFQQKYGVTVVLQAHNALADMLAKALPDIEVVDRSVIPEADGWVPMMSLPLYCELSHPKWVPEPVKPFGLTWHPKSRWHDHGRDGVFWTQTQRDTMRPLRLFVHTRGNAAHNFDFDRSLPDPALLDAIRHDPNVEVVEANYTNAAAVGEKTLMMVEPSWRDTVDLLLTCDRVLTVDTGLAHVAGSLGIPTDVMVPTMPEWRWGLGKDSTPWYPSVKLWRRTHTNDWAEMLGRIHHTLR